MHCRSLRCFPYLPGWDCRPRSRVSGGRWVLTMGQSEVAVGDSLRVAGTGHRAFRERRLRRHPCRCPRGTRGSRPTDLILKPNEPAPAVSSPRIVCLLPVTVCRLERIIATCLRGRSCGHPQADRLGEVTDLVKEWEEWIKEQDNPSPRRLLRESLRRHLDEVLRSEEPHEDGRYFVTAVRSVPRKTPAPLGWTDEEAIDTLRRGTWKYGRLRLF